MSLRYHVQPHYITAGIGYGIIDRQHKNTLRPSRTLLAHLMLREYTKNEAQQVVDWLNGHDKPLIGMLEDWKDPLLNVTGRLSRLP